MLHRSLLLVQPPTDGVCIWVVLEPLFESEIQCGRTIKQDPRRDTYLENHPDVRAFSNLYRGFICIFDGDTPPPQTMSLPVRAPSSREAIQMLGLVASLSSRRRW